MSYGTQQLAMTDAGTGVQAARTGDIAALRAWLDAGADPNTYDDEGWTPLLAAAARGHADAVDLLLSNDAPADPDMRCTVNGALPIHMAGLSGSVGVADAILARRPQHLDRIWEINGHTLLLQAAYYGHTELARFAVERGANTAATTLRGCSAYEIAVQFQNVVLKAVLARSAPRPEEQAAYFTALLARVSALTPARELAAQQLSDRLIDAIQKGIEYVAANPDIADSTLCMVRDLVEGQNADVNRPGGTLRQPPLVVAVTGTNGEPANADRARLRTEIAKMLLAYGANPTAREVHPMGAHAIVRAAEFNHLEILKLMSACLSREALAAALNDRPVVDGLTALHGTVLRAGMAGPNRLPGYLEQIEWAVANGARSDIEDFAGRSQRSIAEHIANPEARRRILRLLAV